MPRAASKKNARRSPNPNFVIDFADAHALYPAAVTNFVTQMQVSHRDITNPRLEHTTLADGSKRVSGMIYLTNVQHYGPSEAPYEVVRFEFSSGTAIDYPALEEYFRRKITNPIREFRVKFASVNKLRRVPSILAPYSGPDKVYETESESI